MSTSSRPDQPFECRWFTQRYADGVMTFPLYVGYVFTFHRSVVYIFFPSSDSCHEFLGFVLVLRWAWCIQYWGNSQSVIVVNSGPRGFWQARFETRCIYGAVARFCWLPRDDGPASCLNQIGKFNCVCEREFYWSDLVWSPELCHLRPIAAFTNCEGVAHWMGTDELPWLTEAILTIFH
jgi:hypothetical protein